MHAAAGAPPSRPYYGIAEAARLLGVNRVTLWRWIAADRLPVWRIGPRSVRIRREDLQRLLSRAGRTGAAGRDGVPDHFVQFYESEDFLAAEVADFIGDGLRAEEATIVIATEPHRRAIDERLRAAGVNVAAATADGRYVVLDAAETLARFMVGGVPDAKRFDEVVGTTVRRAAEGDRSVRAFGEMVALLAQDGEPAAVIRLEQLWNELRETVPFSLLCAYPIDRIDDDVFAAFLADACAAHSWVVPAESYAGMALEEDRSQAVVELQQKAARLEAEIARRMRAERELRDFIESATVPMHWVGPDGTILWANRADLEMLGYDRDDYVGRHIADLHADRAVVEDILRRLAAGETLREHPARMIRKDGSIRHVLIDSSGQWEDGALVHTRCFTRDVTELRRFELERSSLLERERTARAAAERAATRTRRLQEITAQLSRSLDPADVLSSIARSAADLLDAPVGAVFLLDRERPDADFALAAAHGIDAARAPDLRLPRRASLAGRAVDEGRTIVVDEVRGTPGTALPALLTGETAGSEIAAPISAGDERLGVVKAFSPTVRRFSPDDAGLLTALAAAAAVSLTNARLYEEAQDALEQLRLRGSELERVNRELEDTNRGVVALYAELDEKAESLQRANDLKTRYLANMTHEFRTPLNSMLSLSRILLDRVDGDLTPEQDKQVRFIRRSAEELSELVNDLLDIAKVEAGKTVVRLTRFEVADLFGALRGMLRPLVATSSSVALVFEEPIGVPAIKSDESKVSQILRNVISNALRFTERGEVRVRARRDGGSVVFSVSDTGIGIAREDIERIFDEFVQLEGPLQRRSKGTGLGLPLSRKLAALLGGSLTVESQLGVGSTFSIRLPIEPGAHVAGSTTAKWQPDPTRLPVLLVEESPQNVSVYARLLKGTGFQLLATASVADAREALRTATPVAVVLDMLPVDGRMRELVADLKRDPATRQIPVLVTTGADERDAALAMTGVDAFTVRPIDRNWLLRHLRAAQRRFPREQVLIIDDDDVSRYVLQGMLADTRFGVTQASSGTEGLHKARAERPRVIILDLVMPDLSGEEVIHGLISDPETSDIPVIVYTAATVGGPLSPALSRAVAILSKDAPDREAATTALRAALMRATGAVPSFATDRAAS